MVTKGELLKLEQLIKLSDGEPCNHIGCEQHRTHPCEGCGRIGARGARVLHNYLTSSILYEVFMKNAKLDYVARNTTVPGKYEIVISFSNGIVKLLVLN